MKIVIFLGYKFLEFLAYVTPYPVSYFIAGTAAKMVYYSGKYADTLKKNVSIVTGLPQNDIKVASIAKKIYIAWFCNVTDFLKQLLISNEKFNSMVEISGIEHLKKSLKNGKGAVIFTAHIGNFEWGACRIATEGINIWGTGLIRPYHRTNRFFEKRRLSKGLQTLYVNKVMLNTFRILKNNGVIAIPTDFDPLGTAEIYEFFGRKAYIPSGPVEIALKSGAPLIPSFIWRKSKYKHFQIVGEPLDLERDEKKFETRKELLAFNMKKMIAVLEKYIKEHIEEWEMFHNIWAE